MPAAPGVYAWYFRELPSLAIDPGGCSHAAGLPLLYVGISPKKPPLGKPASQQDLRKRLRYHYRGNAAGSTLRLTLGCLLRERLDIELRRVGSGQRLTFATGEAMLSDWMAANALVCWTQTEVPWELEEQLITKPDLPLNLDQNRHHGFHQQLSQMRAECRKRGRELPIVDA